MKAVAKSDKLPNNQVSNNWITFYKKKLEKGVIRVTALDSAKKKGPAVLKQYIQQLEKALEKANVLIYEAKQLSKRNCR